MEACPSPSACRCLAEACWLLRDLPGGPAKVLELVSRGVLRVAFDLERMDIMGG